MPGAWGSGVQVNSGQHAARSLHFEDSSSLEPTLCCVVCLNSAAGVRSVHSRRLTTCGGLVDLSEGHGFSHGTRPSETSPQYHDTLNEVCSKVKYCCPPLVPACCHWHFRASLLHITSINLSITLCSLVHWPRLTER